MYTFENVRVGGFFTEGSERYRKVLHAKCWDPDIKNIRYYNAVGIENNTPAMRLFEDSDPLNYIPRPHRIEPISLDVICKQMEWVIETFRAEEMEIVPVMEEVLGLVKGEEWVKAYERCRGMDTYDLHYIPPEMYDEICERYLEVTKK